MRIFKKTPVALIVMAMSTPVFSQTEVQSVTVIADRKASANGGYPNTVESTTASKIAETINIIDTPDALKYMPSLMVRMRDSADFGGGEVFNQQFGIFLRTNAG